MSNTGHFKLIKRRYLSHSLYYSSSKCVSNLFSFLGLEARIPEENTPVHVINIDIQDNHEEATIGAFMICELAALVSHLFW